MKTLIIIKPKPLLQDNPSKIEHIDENHTWITANGRRIKVKDMTTNHI